MEEIVIKARAKRNSHGNYVGYITVYEGKKRRWSRSTSIMRLYKEDALADARKDAEYTLLSIKGV